MEANPPKVFISYSHDSQEHFDRILLLSDTLREWGIDCHIDQYELAPADWVRWMNRRIREADYVLVVCTATYCRRFNDEEEPGKGLGVRHEGGVISAELYRQTETAKFIPVVFSVADAAHIPTPLQATNRHTLNMEQLETDRGFENLYRQLTKQPRVVPKPLGKMRSLPPINRQEEFDEDNKAAVNGPSNIQQQRIVRLVSTIAKSGKAVGASIELDAQGDENAFALSLTFDPAHLNFINAMLGKDANAATLNVNTTQSAKGHVGLAIALPTGQCVLAGKKKKLITVLFSAKVDESWNQNNFLQFGDQPITRQVVGAQANNLSTSWSPDFVTFLSLPKIITSPKPQSRQKNFTEDLGNGIKLEMIAIPGGSFLMGSEDFDNTKPVHRVTLSQFHIGKYQITQAQWQAVMKTNPSHFKGDNLPVENVSWTDASEFCRKLSEKTGKEFRLPTEAEWEYACLAGSTGKYCFGDDEALLKDYAWFGEDWQKGSTHPVGQKKPNNWGLHDMHGNVWEWCQDWYDADFYAELAKQGEAVNPQGLTNGNNRVLRGGTWALSQTFSRAAYRRVALRGAYLGAIYDQIPLAMQIIWSQPLAERLNTNGFRVLCCRPPSS